MAETRTPMQRAKGYDPDLITVPPIFQRPARPVEMLRWLVTKYMWPQSSLWIAISVVVFHFATPDVSRFASLSVDDVALVWLRLAFSRPTECPYIEPDELKLLTAAADAKKPPAGGSAADTHAKVASWRVLAQPSIVALFGCHFMERDNL